MCSPGRRGLVSDTSATSARTWPGAGGGSRGVGGAPQRRARGGRRGSALGALSAPQPWRLRPQRPAGRMSEVRCPGLPPPEAHREHPSRLFQLWGSLLAFLGGQLRPSSLCLCGLVAFAPGVCVHSSLCLWGHRSWAQGPPVTSITCRDPISKQGHIHGCPVGGTVLPRWSQTRPGGREMSVGRWLGLQEELRPWRDHGGPSGQQRAGPRGAAAALLRPVLPGSLCGLSSHLG